MQTSLKNLPRGLSRVAAGMLITLKFPLTCCSQNAWNFFHSYLVFLTVFNDLSAAMKLSNSWLELSSSCSSSCKNSKNQLESLGYLFLCFVLFLRSRTFPLNMFQSFLHGTFCMATFMVTKTKLLNLAGRTLLYGPLNWPITARVLTERYNNMRITTSQKVLGHGLMTSG